MRSADVYSDAEHLWNQDMEPPEDPRVDPEIYAQEPWKGSVFNPSKLAD